MPTEITQPTVRAMQTPVEEAASRLNVSIKRAPDGACVVQYVEFSQKGTLTRCMFSERNSLSEVLSAQLLAELSQMIDDTDGRVGVHSYPDFILHLPGLMLTKARILVTQASTGVHSILVRFAQCFGNVVAAFSPQARPWQVGHDQTQLIAAESLEKVFIPLMNVADYLRQDVEDLNDAGGGALSESLNRTRSRINELELYYNLLIDFVANNRSSPNRHTVQAIRQISGSEG